MSWPFSYQGPYDPNRSLFYELSGCALWLAVVAGVVGLIVWWAR